MTEDFDLYNEQGKWRQWEKFFDTMVFNRNDPSIDYSKRSALDLGCTTGWSTRALGKRFGRVLGVETDEALYEKAKSPSDQMKTVSFEHASDLATYDAFGERFDFIFSAYTLAYMPDIEATFHKWASLLKPGGTLATLEIQGLFAIHSPLGRSKAWFENFDNEILQDFGYTSNAGTLMVKAVTEVPGLRKLGYLDWSDAELSFDGPLVVGSPVWLGWEERWRRLWPLMNEAGVEEGLHDAFFGCLSHPDHRCTKPVKLLLTRKTTQVQPVDKPQKSKPAVNNHDSENDDYYGGVDSTFPGESGGGDA